jgi:DNA-binding transcriptional ArsR family regulator
VRAVKRARQGARVTLHGIGRPTFKYPELEDSWWYLPDVLRWEPWEPTYEINRASRRLVGRLIVPSLVLWHIPAHVYLGRTDKSNFSMHLKQRTGSNWVHDWDLLHEHIVTSERLSQTVRYSDAELNETHTLELPAPQRRARRRFTSSLVRGVFLDEFSREVPQDDRTTGYPT